MSELSLCFGDRKLAYCFGTTLRIEANVHSQHSFVICPLLTLSIFVLTKKKMRRLTINFL